jgi:hypothetical protein
MSRQTRVLLLGLAAALFTVCVNAYCCIASGHTLSALDLVWPSLSFPLPAVLSERYRTWRESLEEWMDSDVLPRLQSDLERHGLRAPTHALDYIRQRLIERQLEHCATSAILWEVIEPEER